MSSKQTAQPKICPQRIFNDPRTLNKDGFDCVTDNGKLITFWLSSYGLPLRQLIFKRIVTYCYKTRYGIDGGEGLLYGPGISLSLHKTSRVTYDRHCLELLLEVNPATKKNDAIQLLKLPNKVIKEYKKSDLDSFKRVVRYSRKDKLVYCLGITPRFSHARGVLREALAKGYLSNPRVRNLSQNAPLRDSEEKGINLRIVVPYSNVIYRGGVPLRLDQTQPEYAELSDVMEML